MDRGFEVTDPGDPSEVAAERIAADVLAPASTSSVVPWPIWPGVPSTTSGPFVGARSLVAGQVGRLGGASMTPSGASPGRLDVGAGSPLPAPVRSFFEPRFGRGFGDVRIHTGIAAAATAESIDARAFTTGRDIAFGRAAFAPESEDGTRLIAHELAHVVQQGASTDPPAPARPDPTMDRLAASTLAALVSVDRDLGSGARRERRSAELPISGSTSWSGGDPAEAASFVTGGSSKCNLGGAAPIIINNNDECTRPCTQLHERKHVSDWGPCCERARAAYQAPGSNKPAVMAQWNTYLTTNTPWFECRAYARSVDCASAIRSALMCWAPAWAARGVLIGGGMLAGGAIGGAAGAALGTGTGAGAGLAGGPAAPVTVPAGAAAGFITGDVLGTIAGAGLGGAAGAAAAVLRERCCAQAASYLAHVQAQRTANCAAAGGTPVCTF